MKLNTHTNSEGKVFYYVDFGSENHGRTSFRLWVHQSLVTRDKDGKPVVNFPAPAVLVKGKKDWVLRPSTSHTTLDIYVHCGYRGSGTFTIQTPVETVANYSVYRSPVGSLGISHGALVTVSNDKFPVVVHWKRTGRTYGQPTSGVWEINREGKVTEVHEDALLLEEDGA